MKQDRRFSDFSRRGLLAAVAMGWSGAAGFSGSGFAASNGEDIRQPDEASSAAFVARAFEMRDLAADLGDQPYGALIVDPSGKIVGQAPSRVLLHHDPTAHAEMEAIRDATRRLGRRSLAGHVIYSSSRPCPMCEAAAYWANLSAMIHGQSGQNAGSPRLCR